MTFKICAAKPIATKCKRTMHTVHTVYFVAICDVINSFLSASRTITLSGLFCFFTKSNMNCGIWQVKQLFASFLDLMKNIKMSTRKKKGPNTFWLDESIYLLFVCLQFYQLGYRWIVFISTTIITHIHKAAFFSCESRIESQPFTEHFIKAT